MKNFVFLLLSFFFMFNSCSRVEDEISESPGIITGLSGHVINETTGQPVENYKIKLVKSKNVCANWMCGLSSVEVKTVITDKNGYYKIDFLHKLETGESYGLEEQYYGFPYKQEYIPSTGIKAGHANVKDINVWQPIKIIITANIKNNYLPPLIIGNKLKNASQYYFNVENFYGTTMSKTVTLFTKPNSNIDIDFWYNEFLTPSNPIRHLKTQTINTGTTDINLIFDIDCSTF